MKSRYEAVLNGVALSGLSADILILDISYQAPALRDDVFTVAKRHGARVFRRYFDAATVTVSFEIHSYSVQQRQAICNAVGAWAKNGGVLETNDRDGQYLQCVCSEFPAIASARNWTDPLTVSFKAYEIPFWQEKIPRTISFSGISGVGTLWVPGNVDGAFVEARIVANATLTSIELSANGRTMTLAGISIAQDETIVVSYGIDGIQSIKAGTTSLLDKRTGADDLLIDCGARNVVAFEADASADVTFSAKGLWV